MPKHARPSRGRHRAEDRTAAPSAAGARRPASRRLLALLLGVVVLGGGAVTTASAYWGAPAVAGGGGISMAASLNQASTPGAAVGVMQAVTVSWPATTLTNNTPATGYLVRRYDAATNAVQVTGAGCSGTITALTCTEAAVPPGSWKYTVSAAYATSWQGSESPKSASVTVGASVLTLAKTTFGAPLPSVTTGTLTGFQPSEPITYRLDGATALAGSPNAATAGGAATITGLTIPAGTTDGAHTVHAIGGAGSSASFNIVVDTTAPVAGAAVLSPAANGAGWNKTSPVAVTLAGTDTGGSGVAQIRYTLDGSDPSSSGTAATYSSPLSVSSTTTIKYYVVDSAGNVSGVVTKTVKIDTTAPVNAVTMNTVTGTASKSGNTVNYNGSVAGSVTFTNALTDPGGSGPASSGTAALAGTSTGFTHTSSTVSTPAGGPYVSATFSWTAGTTSSPTQTIVGTDAAGNTTTTTLTFVNDSGGPTGGSVDATGLVGTGSRYSTAGNLSIALVKGSDLNGVAGTGAQLRRATAPLTSAGGANGSCGTYAAYAQVGANDPTSPVADTVADQACYRYQYVVADNLGNTSTYTSGDIKVDSTAPSAPTYAFSSLTNAHAVGTTVYYRAGVTGGFTVTAAATDTVSGVASYAMPALGTGWTPAAPGSTGTTAYSFTAAAVAPGAKNLSATNHAGSTSAAATFTTSIDNAAPTGGSVSYPNGYVTSLSVPVTFTTGTDAASGPATGSGVLQRASATLTNGTCGSYSAFGNLATNPTSPYSDVAIIGARCYQYRYLVSDRVGNQATYTSANVAKVDYANVVYGSSSAVGQWRLGDKLASNDTFTGTAGTVLSSHTGETAATWTRWPNDSINAVITASGTLRKATGSTDGVTYYNSAVPASADYQVETDVVVKSVPSGATNIGVLGRFNTGASTSTDGTFYLARYNRSAEEWQLVKAVGGSPTVLGSYSQALGVGTYRLGLDMKGSTIRLLLNGTSRVAATDTSIAAAGRAGVRLGANGESTTQGDNVAYHLDNFRLIPPLTDSRGTNDGAYSYGGFTLAVTGALTGDTDTAVTFNGTSGHATIPDAAALDVGDVFSFEAWVKRADSAITTQTIAQKGSTGFKIGFANNRFTLWRDGTATAIAATTTTQTDTAAFHHYVVTKNGATVKIYVDGVDVTGTVTNATIADTALPLYLSARNGTSEYLNGTLDEAALYSTALSAGTVQDHYTLGHG